MFATYTFRLVLLMDN